MASSSQQSNQTSSSSSSSTPSVISTKENAIINAVSGVASGLAAQMVQWANGVFAQTSKITDQAVANFFQVSQQMQGLSDNLTDQYNDLFAPQNRQLIQEANSYNSDARQKVDMGAAGAVSAQAGDAALKSSEEALRSFGINPSDGRYDALEKAAAVQNAANVAGAQNLQRDRTAQVGRDLRMKAVDVGATMPAAIANVNNTAIQANTGASNATLANANTGANLQRIANDYLRTAMDVKLPPIGQNQKSQSQGNGNSSGSSSSPDPSGGDRAGGGAQQRPGGGSGGGPGGGSGSGGGGPAWMPQHGGAQGTGYGGAGSRGYTGQPSASIRNIAPYSSNPWSQMDWSDPLAGADFSYLNDGSQSNQGPTAFNDYGGPDQWGFDRYDFANNGWDDQWGGGGDYGTYGDISGYEDTQWGNIEYDPSQNQPSAQDTQGWQTYDEPAQADWGPAPGSGGGYSNYDTTSYDSDYYQGDYNSDFDAQGGWYAAGGAIPQRGPPQGGGRVPPQMSPSGGRMVDDVPAQTPQGPAQLNSDEFVIPRDVALWKGQEFFQKLIEQSRSKRVRAPAPGGQSAPARQRQNPPMTG